jgi:hypothetical protein
MHLFRGQGVKEMKHVVILHSPASVAEAQEQLPASVRL